MIKKLFPAGKSKVFTLSYDDGVNDDIRFVELINKYGLKATFNLNSQLMETQFEWIHEKGQVIRRLSPEIAVNLYRGHEIASHTRSHPYMENLTEAEILKEMAMDKEALEIMFDCRVMGFAVPFEYYSDLIESCAVKCGFEYARISEESHSFTPCTNYYRWKGTVFHLDSNLEAFADDFIATQEELAVFQIIGHSYDLAVENRWEEIEKLFAFISRQNDVLPMTNGELVRYLKAMDMAEISDKKIVNNSDLPLFFSLSGKTVCIEPQDSISL